MSGPRVESRGRNEADAHYSALRDRAARGRGVNPLVYWPLRALLSPLVRAYFRARLIGGEHIPRHGPLILASNHRSQLDPLVIGLLIRRPAYYLAKQELFQKRWQAWLLSALGGFPIERGAGDGDGLLAARRILERGDCLVMFPEGTRVRPGPLGRPRRGVARLALSTGAPVVPLAIVGTEAVRNGWRLRPHRIRVRAGAPLSFPPAAQPSITVISSVTERVWINVMLQWGWLGGAQDGCHCTRPGASA
jgi:1-acyl-sn-glycerol-3-phosphate acyltransferase